jgi:hypothetical protein
LNKIPVAMFTILLSLTDKFFSDYSADIITKTTGLWVIANEL